MNIVIATIKSWNIENANQFETKKDEFGIESVTLIHKKEDFTFQSLKALDPDYVFIPHWSWIIPAEIVESFKCIVFHMTDLPYGRGGSPLQNLISRGHKKTKISAIRIDEGIDTGDVYMKRDLDLYGTADEIFMRGSNIVFGEMIPFIVENKPKPKKQRGEVISFKRLKPQNSEVVEIQDLESLYDKIRMLDGEGYPKAFVNMDGYQFEFSRASLKNGSLIADVTIRKDLDE